MDVEIVDFTRNLKDFLKKHKKSKFFIVPHEHADVDAICSALIIQDLLMRFNIRSEIIIEKMNSQAKKLLERFPFLYRDASEFEIEKNEEVVFLIVDTANFHKIPKKIREKISKRKKIKIMLFDHHAENEIEEIADLHIIKRYSSLTRMLYEIYSLLFDINKSIAVYTIAGILSDTGYLRYASKEDLNIISFLINKYNIDLKDFSFLYKSFEDIDKKIKMKALKRLKVFKIKDYWCAYTFVGSEESKIANLLTQLGFDIAICVNYKSKRISIRYDRKLRLFDKGISKGLKEKGFVCGGHESVIGCAYENKKEMNEIREILKDVLNNIL